MSVRLDPRTVQPQPDHAPATVEQAPDGAAPRPGQAYRGRLVGRLGEPSERVDPATPGLADRRPTTALAGNEPALSGALDPARSPASTLRAAGPAAQGAQLEVIAQPEAERPAPDGGRLGPDGGDLPDPANNYSGYTWVGTRAPSGPLFKDGISPLDVHQGGLGTCYLLADLAAMAASDPRLIERLVRQDPDGNFTVTFHRWRGGDSTGLKARYEPVEVRVDRDLVWGLGSGGLGYQNTRPRGADGRELWVAIVEKAYAQLHGGYEEVNGGWMGVTFEELLGRDFTTIFEPSAEQAWSLLQGRAGLPPAPRSVPWEARLTSPASCSTGSNEDLDPSFWESLKALWHSFMMWLGLAEGYASNHAYGILGIGEDAEHGRYVLMYNPWGKYEGQRDGKNDGLFRLPIAEFERAYEDLVITAQ